MRRALFAAALAAAAMLVACSMAERPMVVAAGEGSESAARAVAAALRDRTRLEAAPHAAGTAVEALSRLRDGRADLAFTTTDLLADAVNGQGTFRGATVPARAIAMLSDSVLHLVVLQDSAVNGLSSLRGRKVGTGPAGSATELTALRVLREALLDPARDVSRESLTLPESIAALRERRIDAFFVNGTVPVAALDAAVRDGAVRLRLVSTSSVVSLLQKRFGEALYSAVEIPKGVYGTPEPSASVATGQVLVTRPELPDADAFTIARALISSADALARAHPALEDLLARQGGRPSPAALHPGAARFFKESRP